MIDLLYVTHGRIDLTRTTLPRLLEYDEFQVTVFNNASTDGTGEFLKDISAKKNFTLLTSDRNLNLSMITKNFWFSSDSEFVAKVDNDILLPESKEWINRFVDTFGRMRRLAVAGLFHFDFPKEREKELATLETNGLIIQEYVGGNYVARRKAVVHSRLGGYGLWGWTEAQIEIRKKGWLIGYPWPLVRVLHLESGNEDHEFRIRRGFGLEKARRFDKEDQRWFFGERRICDGPT